MGLGPVMVDLAGVALDAEERELLAHPAVGGVILFSRNFAAPGQLRELTAEIHAMREPRLLIGVDQEGGRVQRFREGFTRLPPAGRFGALWSHDRQRALEACRDVAWLMASELRAAGVDFSFAPVLDVDPGISRVIGDRGFGPEPESVIALAGAWMHGAREAGMGSVGKHFPGHGMVAADSHAELPRDERPLEALLDWDLLPFQRLISQGLEAIMPAHVLYPRIAPEPAGFSPFWLRTVLRERLGFGGVIFSDDLDMQAASAGGGYGERARAARAAGCDMILICNNRGAAVETVEALAGDDDEVSQRRRMCMQGRGSTSPETLLRDPRWQAGVAAVAALQSLASLDPTLADPTDPRRKL